MYGIVTVAEKSSVIQKKFDFGVLQTWDPIPDLVTSGCFPTDKYILKAYFLSFYVLCTCRYVHMGESAHRDQKITSGPLKLDWQAVVGWNGY